MYGDEDLVWLCEQKDARTDTRVVMFELVAFLICFGFSPSSMLRVERIGYIMSVAIIPTHPCTLYIAAC